MNWNDLQFEDTPKMQKASKTPEERNARIATLFSSEVDAFIGSGMKGESPKHWIRETDNGIVISVCFGTRKLALNGKNDRIRITDRTKIKATLNLIKNEIEAGRLSEQIEAAADTWRRALQNRAPKKQKGTV